MEDLRRAREREILKEQEALLLERKIVEDRRKREKTKGESRAQRSLDGWRDPCKGTEGTRLEGKKVGIMA